MAAVVELKAKLEAEKRDSLAKIKGDLKNAGTTGDSKEFSKAMHKYDKQRKSAEKMLEARFQEAVDEQHSFLEIDRALLKERAAQKEE